MCFSTTASFGAGVLLTTIGIVSIKKKQSRYQLMFACIPFVFAIQQFSEGFVWISQLYTTDLQFQKIAIYCFLTFALVAWPGWIPLSVYFIEKNERRRFILRIISGIGIVFSCLAAYYLIFYNSEARITEYHVHYDLNIPYGNKALFGIIYLLPTVISLFISSVKKVPIMGSLVLLSYAVTKFFFDDYVISVWCFFSAIISVMICYILITNSPVYKIKTTYQFN